MLGVGQGRLWRGSICWVWVREGCGVALYVGCGSGKAVEGLYMLGVGQGRQRCLVMHTQK